MTNKERDEILISLLKGFNNFQITLDEIRSEMKNMVTKDEAKKFATKEDLKKFATKEDLKEIRQEFKEDMNTLREEVKEDINNLRKEFKENLKIQKEEIVEDVVNAINVLSSISYERDEKLEARIISNENEIRKLKLAIAN